jgi:hypothetical protein
MREWAWAYAALAAAAPRPAAAARKTSAFHASHLHARHSGGHRRRRLWNKGAFYVQMTTRLMHYCNVLLYVLSHGCTLPTLLAFSGLVTIEEDHVPFTPSVSGSPP